MSNEIYHKSTDNKHFLIIRKNLRLQGPSVREVTSLIKYINTRQPDLTAKILEIKRLGDALQGIENWILNYRARKEMFQSNAPVPHYTLITNDILACIVGILNRATVMLMVQGGLYVRYSPLWMEYDVSKITNVRIFKLIKEFLKTTEGITREIVNTLIDDVINNEERSTIIWKTAIANPVIKASQNAGIAWMGNRTNKVEKVKTLWNSAKKEAAASRAADITHTYIKDILATHPYMTLKAVMQLAGEYPGGLPKNNNNNSIVSSAPRPLNTGNAVNLTNARNARNLTNARNIKRKPSNVFNNVIRQQNEPRRSKRPRKPASLYY